MKNVKIITSEKPLLLFEKDDLKSDEIALLGHLLCFRGRVYDPDLGLVEVDPADVGPHNNALDALLLASLDDRCEVGQWGFFYYQDSPPHVRTFTGVTVADEATVNGRVITFSRKGKTFRGWLLNSAKLFRFKRIK